MVGNRYCNFRSIPAHGMAGTPPARDGAGTCSLVLIKYHSVFSHLYTLYTMVGSRYCEFRSIPAHAMAGTPPSRS